MRYRINIRFLLLLVLAAVALGTGLMFIYRRQVARQVADLPKLAERAETDGKTERALRFLRLYMAKRPADLDARVRYAELLGKEAEAPYQVRQVMAQFEQVLEADPTRSELRRRITELYLRQRSYKEALGHAQALERAAPSDPAVLDLVGRCQAALGDHPKAVQSYEKAVASPAVQLETFRRLASSLMELKKPAAAEAAMDQMVDRFATSHAAYLIRAAFWLNRDDKTNPKNAGRVKADFAKAVSLSPQDADILFLSAGLAQETDDKAAARGYLEKGITLHPKDSRFYAALAQIEMAAGKKQEAVALLKKGAAQVGENVETAVTTAELFLLLGETAAAREMIGKTGGRLSPPEAVRVRVVEGRIAMAEGEWAKAYRILEQVRTQLTDSSARAADVDLSLATCAANLRMTQQRVNYARRAASAARANPTMQYALATALVDAGRVTEAEEAFRPLAARDGAPESLLLQYARVLLAVQRGTDPASRNWGPLDAVLKRLGDPKTAGPQVNLVRAEAVLARGDAEAARKLLTEASNAAPKDVSLWIGLAVLQSESEGPKAAAQILNTAEARAGDSLELRTARLQLEYSASNPTGPALLDRLAVGVDKFPVAQRVPFLLRLADANARSGRAPVAKEFLATVLKLQPTDLGSWLYLCAAAAAAEDAEALTAGGQMVRRLEGPGGVNGTYAEASLLAYKASKGDLSAVAPCRALVQNLRQRDPESPRPYLLAAGLDQTEKNTAAATENILAAVRRGERRPEMVRPAVRQLITQRKYQEAESLIRSLDQDRLSPGLLRDAEELSLLLDNPARAVTLVSKAQITEKSTPDDLHWVAFVYMAAGKPAESEQNLREAIRRGGGADCRTALVRLLAGSPGGKDPAKAEAAALEAADKTPAGRLAAAECRQLLGETEKADAHVNAALAAAPNDPVVLAAAAAHFTDTNQFPLALPNLRRLASGAAAAGPQAVAEARRSLAAGLAATGGRAECQEALDTLAANEREFPNDLANGPARAYTLSQIVGRRKEAVRWYEQAQQKQGLNPAQLKVLSDLYDLTRQWAKAKVVLRQLYGNGGKATAAELAECVGRYLRYRDADGAADWLRRLRQLEPDSVRTRTLTARAAALRGRRPEAVEALHGVTATTPTDQTLLAAVWEEIGETDRAKDILAADASKAPVNTLNLIYFYGRTGAVSKAVDVCEQALRDKLPADAVVVITLDAVRARVPDPSLYSRLDKMIQSSGEAVRWAEFFRSEVAEEQGRYDDAVVLLDAFLKRDPANAIALVRRGWLALLHEKQPADAERFADAAIAAKGRDTNALLLKAAALAVAGKTVEAGKELDASDGDDAQVPFRQARLALAEGRRGDADDLFRAATHAGLTERSLHPLERSLIKQMTTQLAPAPSPR